MPKTVCIGRAVVNGQADVFTVPSAYIAVQNKPHGWQRNKRDVGGGLVLMYLAFLFVCLTCCRLCGELSAYDEPFAKLTF